MWNWNGKTKLNARLKHILCLFSSLYIRTVLVHLYLKIENYQTICDLEVNFQTMAVTSMPMSNCIHVLNQSK